MAVIILQNEKELLVKIAIRNRHAFTVVFKHYERGVYAYSKEIDLLS